MLSGTACHQCFGCSAPRARLRRCFCLYYFLPAQYVRHGLTFSLSWQHAWSLISRPCLQALAKHSCSHGRRSFRHRHSGRPCGLAHRQHAFRQQGGGVVLHSAFFGEHHRRQHYRRLTTQKRFIGTAENEGR